MKWANADTLNTRAGGGSAFRTACKYSRTVFRELLKQDWANAETLNTSGVDREGHTAFVEACTWYPDLAYELLQQPWLTLDALGPLPAKIKFDSRISDDLRDKIQTRLALIKSDPEYNKRMVRRHSMLKWGHAAAAPRERPDDLEKVLKRPVVPGDLTKSGRVRGYV